jgi:hypothetical protein
MATSSKAGDKPVKAAAKRAAPTATQPKATKPAAKPADKPAAKAPAEKAAAAKKAPAPKKVAAETAPARSAAVGQFETRVAIPELTPDQRRYYVEVAAYYIAERRGFHGGSEMDDWVQAESEIDRLIREGILKP